jgi:hypothetical protein
MWRFCDEFHRERSRARFIEVAARPGGTRLFCKRGLSMTKQSWFSRLIQKQFDSQKSLSASALRMAGGVGAALLLAGAAAAQNAAAPAQGSGTAMSVPNGYSVHQVVDVGGRLNDVVGSGAMYDSLMNLHSGPRVFNEMFEMHALPGRKNTLVDDLTAFGTGFGGDPMNVARLDVSKSKDYEFSALFRRDRKYFDYDLLGNPNIPGGQTMPIGPSNAPTGTIAWPQTLQSPFLFNTVRRMTDTSLTLLPLSAWTFRVAYAKSVMEGPSLSPSGYQFAKYNAVLQEFQRNSTDDLTMDVDWKPVMGTKFTYEEQLTHYKGDSYFTLNPSALIAQEADGTPVALNDYDSLSPYGIGACATGSMGTAYSAGPPPTYTIFTPPTAGHLPVINPACSVVTNYLRSMPTRVLFPTEVLRLQSASLKKISMNGDVRFTNAHMHLPNYHDSYQGLNNGAASATRSLTYLANANGRREVLASDFGVVWQTTERFSLAEQINYSTFRQPGTILFTSGATLATPGNPNETINYATLTTVNAAAGAATFEGSPNIGAPASGYTGQLYFTNNATASWDASARMTFSFTYRYQDHAVAEGIPHNAPLPVGAVTGGTVIVHENAGVFDAALRPAANWDVNGSAEVGYDDNALTPVSPRQLRHYRVHSIWKPRPWATISGAYNDLERHNNTNNNQAAVAANDDPYEGPLDHVDHSRIASLSASLTPNEHYAFDLSYSYIDVYAATNICFDNGNQNASTVSGAYPGTATLNASGAPNVCPGVFTRGSATQLADWYGRDFMDAPTQFGFGAITLSPTDKVHYGFGYRISAVNGSQFFNDARAVNGSLVSTFETPYLNFAYKARPGLTLKADYNFYGYGEGGPSGPENCSLSTSATSTVVPCTSFTGVTGVTGLTGPAYGQTAPRNFHSNNVTLGMRYEF